MTGYNFVTHEISMRIEISALKPPIIISFLVICTSGLRNRRTSCEILVDIKESGKQLQTSMQRTKIVVVWIETQRIHESLKARGFLHEHKLSLTR